VAQLAGALNSLILVFAGRAVDAIDLAELILISAELTSGTRN
jgi:hypothetical protein